MNYANMIEEKGLKKGFIIATLISTIVGTFTTGINLYDRIGERRKQVKTDNSQNEKIRELERRADKAEGTVRRKEQLERQRERSYSRDRDYPRDPRDRDVRHAMVTSGPLIRDEYDRDVARLGRRFAEGDTITQTQLQGLIIDLQASVIRLLQDALLTGRMPDPALLYVATGRARTDSIRALQDQYQRMLVAAPMAKALPPPPIGSHAASSFVGSHVSSQHHRRAISPVPDTPTSTKVEYSSKSMVVEDGKRGSSNNKTSSTDAYWSDQARRVQPQIDRLPLFCRYARDLQRDPHLPVELYQDNDVCKTKHAAPEEHLSCPECGTWFSIVLDHSWKVHKPVVVGKRVEEILDDDNGGESLSETARRRMDKPLSVSFADNKKRDVEIVEDHVLAIDNRFVLKCHRPPIYSPNDISQPMPPTFACCLCERYGRDDEPVVVCSTMARLVSHINDDHSLSELLGDPDIREVRAPRP